MSYQTYKSQTASEKFTLAWLEPSRRKIVGWTVHNDSVFCSAVDKVVVNVHQDGTELRPKNSISEMTEGTWFYDLDAALLYVWSVGGAHPSSVWTEVTYRLLFSNAPVTLPFDLQQGKDVYYLPCMKSESRGASQLDENGSGIVLEGFGRITFENYDSIWQEIFDKYSFQTKRVQIFSHSSGMPASEARRIYSGLIVSQSYSKNTVSFGIKDTIYLFRADVNLPLFTDSDGVISDALKGKPKRRIYGRVSGLHIESIDQRIGDYQAVQINGQDNRSTTEILFSLPINSDKGIATHTDINHEICAGDSLVLGSTTFKVKSLAQVDIGLSKDSSSAFTYIDATTFRFTFNDIDVSNLEVGQHVSFLGLDDAPQLVKDSMRGIGTIKAISGPNIDVTMQFSLADFGTKAFSLRPGEIIVTRASNTPHFWLGQKSKSNQLGIQGFVRPTTPYRRFNRKFFLAHHALSEVEASLVKIRTGSTYELSTVANMSVGDHIVFPGGLLNRITAVNPANNNIQTASLVNPRPVEGGIVRRSAVQRLKFGDLTFEPIRDFKVVFTSQGALAELSTTAERNVSPPERLGQGVIWLKGSKQVVCSGGLFESAKVRDWIRQDDDDIWYEIQEVVNKNCVVLSKPFEGSTGSAETSIVRPTYIENGSLLSIDTYGATKNGSSTGDLIRTAADVSKHLIYEVGLTDSDLDIESFKRGSDQAPYLVSLAVPSEPRKNTPKVRDILTQVNSSVFGIVHYDQSFKIRFDMLTASRNQRNAIFLDDTDILSATVTADSTRIYQNILARYRHQDIDETSQKSAFDVVSIFSRYVTNSRIEPQTLTTNTYLYDEYAARIIANRLCFMNELPKSDVEIETKIQQIDVNLGQVVVYRGDRLYKRLGAPTALAYRIGVVSRIEKTGLGVKMRLSDFGNIFNRASVITDPLAVGFDSASDIEKLFNCFITDSYGIVSELDETFNSNLIS